MSRQVQVDVEDLEALRNGWDVLSVGRLNEASLSPQATEAMHRLIACAPDPWEPSEEQIQAYMATSCIIGRDQAEGDLMTLHRAGFDLTIRKDR